MFSTLIAPLARPAPSVVAHFKTMHAFTAPRAIRPEVRLYRRLGYPRTARTADAIIINSESLRAEVLHYLDVDPGKLRLIPEAVDHDLFTPGDPEEARRRLREEYGVRAARSSSSSRPCGRTRTARACCAHSPPFARTSTATSSWSWARA